MTNFDMSRYDVESILNSDLPIGSISSSKKVSDISKSGSASAEQSQDYLSLLALHYPQQQQQQQLQEHGGYYNSSNIASGFEIFGSGFNMDFSTGSRASNGTNSGASAMSHYEENRQIGGSYSSAIPYAMPVVIGGGYDNSASNSNSWVSPYGYYSYPGATNSGTSFHTALFGME